MAERIDALQGVITRANVQIKSCQKAIAKSEKEVATTQEELEQLIARNVELKKEKEEIATQGKEVAEWYNKFQEVNIFSIFFSKNFFSLRKYIYSLYSLF